jgi:hypothetical protein
VDKKQIKVLAMQDNRKKINLNHSQKKKLLKVAPSVTAYKLGLNFYEYAKMRQ